MLKHCGVYLITDFDDDLSEAENVDKNEAEFLDKFCEAYLKHSAWALVNKTHEKGSAWDKVYGGGRGDKTVIPGNLLWNTVTM